MLGIFDSGVGGLTVVRELLRRHPQASFVYFGDTARTPYGNKSADRIRAYAEDDVRFLLDHGVTSVVAACNTVSAVAMDHLRATFPSVPFFDVITPVVETALSLSVKTIGVIGTRATIGSDIYARLLRARDPSLDILSVACPLFVPIVEENWMRHPETKRLVRTYLQPLRQKQVDALILGCTHYPFLADVIRASLQKRVNLVDTPSAVVSLIERAVPDPLVQRAAPQRSFYFSDETDQTKQIVARWIGT